MGVSIGLCGCVLWINDQARAGFQGRPAGVVMQRNFGETLWVLWSAHIMRLVTKTGTTTAGIAYLDWYISRNTYEEHGEDIIPRIVLVRTEDLKYSQKV